jgi:acyl carrier protein
MPVTRDAIITNLMRIFREEFEIENPGLDDDLREAHGFDSIDAIELLREIEEMMGYDLTQEQKKGAMGIRTLGQIADYIEELAPRPDSGG